MEPPGGDDGEEREERPSEPRGPCHRDAVQGYVRVGEVVTGVVQTVTEGRMTVIGPSDRTP